MALATQKLTGRQASKKAATDIKYFSVNMSGCQNCRAHFIKNTDIFQELTYEATEPIIKIFIPNIPSLKQTTLLLGLSLYFMAYENITSRVLFLHFLKQWEIIHSYIL